jgi:hypothetical protein
LCLKAISATDAWSLLPWKQLGFEQPPSKSNHTTADGRRHAHLKVAAEKLNNTVWLLIFKWADSLPALLGIRWRESDKALVLLCIQPCAAQSSWAALRLWRRTASAVKVALDAATTMLVGEDPAVQGQESAQVRAEIAALRQQLLAAAQRELHAAADAGAAKAKAAIDRAVSAAAQGDNNNRYGTDTQCNSAL